MNDITKIINKWDPIGLFPMAPRDEYIEEVKEIEKIVACNKSISVNELAEKINLLFVKRFGADVYHEDISQCILVAEAVLARK